MQSKKVISVAVLGGGFGGLRCALDIKRRGGKQVKVTLIDQSPYHTYYPYLYEIPAAPENVSRRGLESLVYFSLAEICAARGIEFLPATVQAIQPRNQQIILARQSAITYDYLVVALGSIANDFGIPGIAEYAISFRGAESAFEIRERLHRLAQGKHRPGRIIVGGAGATGVEVIAELAQHAQRLCRRHHRGQSCYSFTLVEALPQILSGLNPSVAEIIVRRLTGMGVKIMNGCAVTEVKAQTAVVTGSGDKQELPFELFIWTAGSKPSPVVAAAVDLPHDHKGKLEGDEFLRVKDHNTIFALGDAVLFSPNDAAGRGLPELAQVAIAQGKIVAKNILHTMAHEPLQPFVAPPLRYVVPVGGSYAIAQLKHARLAGWLAHAGKGLVYFVYLTSIISFPAAGRRWLRAMRLF